ncbi:MAG: hypothetical protein LW807_07530, partial [Proteobacteria bacterium]|nr:hypothetical protein [Pseudomonadota bacterium]
SWDGARDGALQALSFNILIEGFTANSAKLGIVKYLKSAIFRETKPVATVGKNSLGVTRLVIDNTSILANDASEIGVLSEQYLLEDQALLDHGFDIQSELADLENKVRQTIERSELVMCIMHLGVPKQYFRF